MRIIVLLPQPEGPTNTPTSPGESAKQMPASTSWRSPAAFSYVLLRLSASSCTEPPAGYTGFKWLHQQGFDDQHDGGKAQRIGQQKRNVEELEGDTDFEADAVRPSEQFGNQHDFPDQ